MRSVAEFAAGPTRPAFQLYRNDLCRPDVSNILNMSYQEKPLVSQKMRSYLGKALPKSFYLRYFGRHEEMSLRIWRSVAGKVPPESVILDVGAFEGEFALEARNENESPEIYAFEPNPDSFQRLLRACENKNISLVQKALFDQIKTVYFECNSQVSAITNSGSERDKIPVEAITLDSWIGENRKSPAAIKIDVEDAVGAVLRGSRKTLKQHRPIVLCEILDADAGEEAIKVLPSEYKHFLINENKGLESNLRMGRYDWRYKNWLLVPIEKEMLIKEFICD